MKKIFVYTILLGSLAFAACQQNGNSTEQKAKNDKALAAQKETYYTSKDTEYARPNASGGYGESFKAEGVMALTDFVKKYDGKGEQHAVLSAKVESVCKMKGCWMQLDKGDGSTMRVKFKDYAFFVPRDIIGKTAIVDGTVAMDTTSVKQLKHFAEDDGKNAKEIAAITQPEYNLVFHASGVYLK